MIGKINSIQTLGALDGPGIRYTVFIAGCNLRCGCCHNPDTWTLDGAREYSSDEIINNALRYREYFGNDGGITLSGGEPLLQAEFVTDVFRGARENGINTCLDTSGSIINDAVRELLRFTDRVLLDIKYTSEMQYQKHVGTSLSAVLDFLSLLEEMKIKTTVRQVIIPTLNDSEESLSRLRELTRGFSVIDGFEFLPFRKMCRVKYENLKIPFPFDQYDEPSDEEMDGIKAFFEAL